MIKLSSFLLSCLMSFSAYADSSAYIDTVLTAGSAYDQTAVAVYYVSLKSDSIFEKYGGNPSFYLGNKKSIHIPPKEGYYVAITALHGSGGQHDKFSNDFEYVTCHTYKQIMQDEKKVIINVGVNSHVSAECRVHPNFSLTW